MLTLRTLKAFSLIAFLGLIVFATFGCGNNNNNQPYVIGRDPRWDPLDLHGKEKNLVAFSDDLLVQIGLEENISFSRLSVPARQLEASLADGDFDGILSTMTPNAVRRSRYVFSDPYFLTGPVLIVAEGSTIESLKGMQGLDLGVIGAKLMLLDNQVGKDVNIRTFQRSQTALEALLKGDIDGILVSAFEAFAFTGAQEKNSSLKVLGPPLNQEGVRLVARKGEGEQLIEHFNDGLKQLRKKSRFKQLIRKWGLYNPFFD